MKWKAVRELRDHLGESQQAFANRLGLSIRAVANYESNRQPTGRALAALAKAADAAGKAELASAFLAALGRELGLNLMGAHTTPEEEQVRMAICRQVLVKFNELRGNPAAFLCWLESEAFSRVPKES